MTNGAAERAARRIEEMWKLQLGDAYWPSESRVEHETAIITEELEREKERKL